MFMGLNPFTLLIGRRGLASDYNCNIHSKNKKRDCQADDSLFLKKYQVKLHLERQLRLRH